MAKHKKIREKAGLSVRDVAVLFQTSIKEVNLFEADKTGYGPLLVLYSMLTGLRNRNQVIRTALNTFLQNFSPDDPEPSAEDIEDALVARSVARLVYAPGVAALDVWEERLYRRFPSISQE